MRWLILAAVLLAAALPARAQETPSDAPDASDETGDAATESARAHFRLGVDFYRERNFRAALIEFQRAYADAPHYKLLYNLGQASLELQEYAGAIDYFTAYLKEGGDAITPERRKEVEDSIRYLESRIARVTIASNRPGAEIYVDDTLVGRLPLDAPVRVGAGRHKFTAVAEGMQPVERMVDVAAQEQREIQLDFEERPKLVAPVRLQPVEAPHVDESSGSAATWAGVATAMLGATAITMTVLAALAQKAYDDELDTVTTQAALDELRDDAETKALVTDIAWGATLVSGAITAILIVSDDAGEDEREGAVGVRLSPTGIAVDGRF